MLSKNDFFHYVGERLRSPEGNQFARGKALLANKERLTVLAQLRIRHRRVDVRSGSKAALMVPKSNFRFTPESGLSLDIAKCSKRSLSWVIILNRYVSN
jgi:hypothetical protein